MIICFRASQAYVVLQCLSLFARVLSGKLLVAFFQSAWLPTRDYIKFSDALTTSEVAMAMMDSNELLFFLTMFARFYFLASQCT